MNSTDVYVYGFRAFGQLHKNPFLSVLQQLGQSVSVADISFSWTSCCTILNNGNIFMLGFIESSPNKKKQIHPPSGRKCKKVLCMETYHLLLMEDGSCWKYQSNNRWIGPITLKGFENLEISDVASTGEDINLVLFNNGSVLNYPDMKLYFPRKVKKICCGLEHYVCLLESGSIYVWGNGSRGQLGNNMLTTVENPSLLEYLDGLFVKDIDTGGWHTAAVTYSGDLYTWGWNNFGQLGFRSDQKLNLEEDYPYVSVLPEPSVVEWDDCMTVSVKQISCGISHTVILCEDDAVWGCGCNKYGQINPILQEKHLDKMTRLPIPENVSIIRKVFCYSWNTALYVTLKDVNRDK